MSREESDSKYSKIIAIGGSKGGIGKSILAVNLAVFLARRGKRAIVVDLDLGSANAHLLLGETLLKLSVNDYLHKKVPALTDVMVETRYGVGLIGGDSSELGASNIQFARKVKLLRSIGELAADCVILDLGGDASYNIIDFFLFADRHIVVTTCDPASYLNAYNFIKVALHRKMTRFHGAESEAPSARDEVLEKMLEDYVTSSRNGTNISVEELLSRISTERPSALALVQDLLRRFSPSIVVNRSLSEESALGIANRIQEVCRRILSIDVAYLGMVGRHEEIERSARSLVPVVIAEKGGRVFEELSSLFNRIVPS